MIAWVSCHQFNTQKIKGKSYQEKEKIDGARRSMRRSGTTAPANPTQIQDK